MIGIRIPAGAGSRPALGPS